MKIDVSVAIEYLVENEGLKIPHEIAPWSSSNSEPHLFTEAEWNSYAWNPVPEEPHLGLDPEAHAKPSWERLLVALEAAPVAKLKEELRLRIDNEVTHNRIPQAYGQDTTQQEILFRLSGRHTPEQDAERDRLRAVAQVLKDVVEASLTIEALQTIDPEEDSTWS